MHDLAENDNEEIQSEKEKPSLHPKEISSCRLIFMGGLFYPQDELEFHFFCSISVGYSTQSNAM